ncbi:MAG: MFS transporter [Chloroflexota bacterium]
MNKKAFVSLCLAIFTAMLGLGIISPLMGLYANSMPGANGFLLGFMYSGFSLTRTIVLPVAGWFSDMKGRKILMVIGLAGYALISLLYVAAGNIYQLILVRMLHGVCSSMVVPIAQAYVGELIPEGKEGTYMNIYSMIMFLGMGVGPLLGGTLSDIFEVNTVFYVMGGFAAAALVLLIVTVPNLAPQTKYSEMKSPSIRLMLKDNRMKVTSLFMASRGIMRQSINAFLPIFAVTMLGMSRSTIGAVLTAFMLCEAFSGGLAGPMSDRMNKKVLMMIGAVMAPLLVFMLPSRTGVVSILLVLIPLAIVGGVGRAPAMAYNVQAGRHFGRMGASMGLVNTAMAVGNFFGPMASGYIMDNWGVGQIYYFGGTVGIIAAVFIGYWLFKREDKVVEAAILSVKKEATGPKD